MDIEATDVLGRMPEAVLVDRRTEPTDVLLYHGSSTFDRPSTDDLLGAIDDASDEETASQRREAE